MIPLRILKRHLFWHGEQWEWESRKNRQNELNEEEGTVMPDDLLKLDKFKEMVEVFYPLADEDMEKKLLDEKDDIRKEKLMKIERR